MKRELAPRTEIFISVDVETAGGIPEKYSLLSIGACNADDDSQVFHCFLKPVNDAFEPEAMKVTGLSLEQLRRDGLDPAEAMLKFQSWIERISTDRGSGTERVPVFVGLNAPFDWGFVNGYFVRYLGRNPFGVTALDVKALYMGATGCSWDETRSSRMAARLQPRLSGTHDALADAKYQAELFRLVRDMPLMMSLKFLVVRWWLRRRGRRWF